MATLASRHPGLQISLTDTHPPEALDLLRAGKIDVAVIFRYDETEPEPDGVRLHHLLDDPRVPAVDPPRAHACRSPRRDMGRRLRTVPKPPAHAVRRARASSRVSATRSDDMVVMQALVAAGLGVTTIPGLALQAHRAKGVVASELAESHRHVYAATYGQPPDPPATAALLTALAEAATAQRGSLKAAYDWVRLQHRTGDRGSAPRRASARPWNWACVF